MGFATSFQINCLQVWGRQLEEKEELENDDVSKGGRRPAITMLNYSGLTEECQDEAKSDLDSVEGNWEVVSRIKQKKSSNTTELKTAEKKQRRSKQTKLAPCTRKQAQIHSLHGWAG